MESSLTMSKILRKSLTCLLLILVSMQCVMAAPLTLEPTLPKQAFEQLPVPVLVKISATEWMKLKDQAPKTKDEERGKILAQMIAARACPVFDIFSQGIPFAVEITDNTGTIIVPAQVPDADVYWILPPWLVEHSKETEVISLVSRTSRLYLIDLYKWTRSLRAGKYTVRIILYPNTRYSVTAEQLPLEVLPVTEHEASTITAIFGPDRGTGYGEALRRWLTFTADKQELLDGLKPEMQSALQLYVFFARSMQAKTAAEAPVDMLPGLPDYLRPYTLLLRYEIAIERKDDNVAHDIEKEMMEQYADELEWRLAEQKLGKGFLKQSIEQARILLQAKKN